MKDELHIGKLIRSKLEEEGRTPTWLAKYIPCSKKHVYKIFNQQDIHPQQLKRISIIMKFNFFSYYSESVRKDIELSTSFR